MDFRDKEDFYSELGDVYSALGNKERAEFFYGLEDEEHSRSRSLYGGRILRLPEVKSKIIYSNAPCPCGSGKKYKKCCGRK